MNWQDCFDTLKKYLHYTPEKGHLRHNLESSATLVPFKTRGDDKIDAKTILLSVGEFSRIVSGKNLKSKIDSPEICREILEDPRIEYDEKEMKPLFKSILETAIEENILNPQIKNPYFLKFMDVEEKGKRVRDIACYTYWNLYEPSEKIENLFRARSSRNLISKLLGESLEKRLEKFEFLSREWENLQKLEFFPELSRKFNEDFNYLAEHPEYFLKNMGDFFNYYIMMFIFQMIVNINRMEKGEFRSKHPLYFAVDSESSSIKRKSYSQGYRYLREVSSKTYYHMNVLEHLGILFQKRRSLYPELEHCYEEFSPESKQEFIENFLNWMECYRKVNRMDESWDNHLENLYIEDLPISFREIYKTYLQLIETAHSTKEKKGTYIRYTSCIEEIAKENFLKARGSMGFTFNLTQNFILFMSSLAVKGEPLQAKGFFREFEMRGIFLDSPSKEKILEILEKNNLIEKKSDGGEVQYVKPLL